MSSQASAAVPESPKAEPVMDADEASAALALSALSPATKRARLVSGPGQQQALFNAGVTDVDGFGSFSMFVESALSPLSSQLSSQPMGGYGGVGQDSPHAHRDVGALPHSNDNSQLSLMIPPPLPSSNDWSPTVGSLGGGVTSGDFKPMFSDSDRGSRMSSPSVPHPRMRHKQKAVETMMDIHSLDGPVSVGDGDGVFSSNRQALARRIRAPQPPTGPGAGPGSQEWGDTGYERCGIADSPFRSHFPGGAASSSSSSSSHVLSNSSRSRSRPGPGSGGARGGVRSETEPRAGVTAAADDEGSVRRSGRGKVPSKGWGDGEFELGDSYILEADTAEYMLPSATGAGARGASSASKHRSPHTSSSSSSSSTFALVAAAAAVGGAGVGSSSTGSKAPFPQGWDATAVFASVGMGLLRCNCKKSRCLKLYCECLHALKFCDGCNCQDCENTVLNAVVRDEVIALIRDKNPEAFAPKVQILGASMGHLQGCHCKKSGCLKKYCECFALGVACTGKCRCADCKNYDAAGPAPGSLVGGDGGSGVKASKSSPRGGGGKRGGRPAGVGTPSSSSYAGGTPVQPGSGDTPHPSPETALGAAVLLAMSPKKPDSSHG